MVGRGGVLLQSAFHSGLEDLDERAERAVSTDVVQPHLAGGVYLALIGFGRSILVEFHDLFLGGGRLLLGLGFFLGGSFSLFFRSGLFGFLRRGFRGGFGRFLFRSGSLFLDRNGFSHFRFVRDGFFRHCCSRVGCFLLGAAGCHRKGKHRYEQNSKDLLQAHFYIPHFQYSLHLMMVAVIL